MILKENRLRIIRYRAHGSYKRQRLLCIGPLLLVLALFAAGCGGDKPAPTPTATKTPPAATESPTLTTVDDTVMIEVTLEPTPMTSTAETLAADPDSETVSSANVAVETTPVVEDEQRCAVESDLDLAGYPDLESIMGCALEPARTDPVGFNEFGPGPDFNRFMLWLSWEVQIYVLLPEGTWTVYPDTWSDEMPEFVCNPTNRDPASPPLPRRGFGKVWCENDEAREKMGLIAVEERLCQHTVTQAFERGRMVACFEDATIRYYKLFNDSSWQAVLQP